MSKVKIAKRGCWEWNGCKSGSYGRFYFKGKSFRAHRMAWLIFNGQLSRKLVLHSCNNPLCVRPSHLYIGTDKDNAVDRKACGHETNGEKHGNHKLSWNIVRYIRSRYARGKTTMKELANIFNVSASNIGLIIRYKGWVEE